jgi:cytidylate kinase
MQPVITIDGGAGTGTSSLAEELASRLGASMLNSGSIYRALTWLCLEHGIEIDKYTGLTDASARSAVVELAQSLHVEFKSGEVIHANGRYVEPLQLRQMSPFTPFIAEIPEAREQIRRIQHRFAEDYGFIIAEGRDLGTVVFPNAIRKIFLRCDDVERARRRSNAEHRRVTVADLQQRDAIDAERDESPMEAHIHALVFDTTNTSVPELAQNVINSMRGVPELINHISQADRV